MTAMLSSDSRTFTEIFKPLRVRGVLIPNRVTMLPMGSNFASASGALTDAHLRYYKERARGGTGLIMVENACVEYPRGSNGFTQLRLDHDQYIPRFYELTEAVHSLGSVIGIQINHSGASAVPSRTGEPAISASDQPSKTGGTVPVPMTHEQIAEVVKAYGDTARRAKAAGFDLVEIHAGHSYLLNQFLSPHYNKRTDQYGGTPKNRARIVKEVVEEVRRQVGPRTIISLRLSAEEWIEGGNHLEDTLALAEFFQSKVDIFNVSSALNDNLQYQIDKMSLPDGWRSNLATAFKERFGKPVIASGNIRDPHVAEQLLAEGKIDLVGIGRGLIADPWWARKVAYGRADEVVPCISCNIGCADNRIRLGRPIRCTVNPDVFDNESYKKRRVTEPVRVVVLGGGVAGLEAACTAAEVGCDVTLFERDNALGGIIRNASENFPAKARIGNYLEFMRKRAARVGVDVSLGVEATLADVEPLDPTIIINATGSSPLIPPIPGLRERIDVEGTNVYSIDQAMRRINEFTDLAGKNVVVVGAGAVGLDIIEHIGPQGPNITLVDRLPAVAPELDLITRLQMMEVLDEHDVEIRMNTALLEVSDSHLLVDDPDGEHETLESDLVFVALGMKSERGPLDELLGRFAGTPTRVANIGDSRVVRRIIDGVREGRDILNLLEDMNVL